MKSPMLLWMLWIIILHHHSLARDICTKSAVLEQTGIVQMATSKSLPISADVTSQLEVVQSLEKKNDMMKLIKEDLLEDVEYSPSLIYNNIVIKAIDSTLPNAREHCSDLGQGFDVIFAKEDEVDWDFFVFAAKHMRETYREDELPIGVVPNNQGLVTLTGGWVDQFPTNYIEATNEKYRKMKLLVVLSAKNYGLVPPQDGDEKRAYKVLCTRPARFIDLNSANFHFMDMMLDEVETTVDSGERKWKQKALEYKQMPKSTQVRETKLFKLQPLTAFMDVVNGVSKLGTEAGWSSDSLSTNFLQMLSKKAKKVFEEDIFRAQLTPKDIKKIETGFNLGGKIANVVASFKADKSTPKNNVYNGQLQVQVASKEETYDIYKLKSLLIGNQLLTERYLVKKGTMAFTTKDLSLFRNCPIMPVTSATTNTSPKAMVCNSVITPTVEAKKCANEILHSKPLQSCDFEYTNDPVAIRTNCAGGTNVIVSTPHKINVNMVCNGKQSSNFEIPQGSHRLSTGCGMKLGNLQLLNEDKTDANQVPPSTIMANEEFLADGEVDEITLVSVISLCGLVSINMVIAFVFMLCKCKKKPTRLELHEENMMLQEELQEMKKIKAEKAARVQKSGYY